MVFVATLGKERIGGRRLLPERTPNVGDDNLAAPEQAGIDGESARPKKGDRGAHSDYKDQRNGRIKQVGSGWR